MSNKITVTVSCAQVLAALIKAMRKQAGLNQKDLSDLSGLSQSMISRIERNGADVNFAKVVAVAAALDMMPSRLVMLYERVSEKVHDDLQDIGLKVLPPNAGAPSIAPMTFDLGRIAKTPVLKGAIESLVDGIVQVAAEKVVLKIK